MRDSPLNASPSCRRAAFLAVLIASSPTTIAAQTPRPGPYYFVSDTFESTQFYWGGRTTYGGVKIIENLNLLATVLGDDPNALLLPGQFLVSPETFDFGGGSCTLQPFAYVIPRDLTKYGLPIGAGLAGFLTNPLAGAPFDLTLPFSDPNVGLSDRSALLRQANTAGTWHTAIDWDHSASTNNGFNILAPADGVVEGNGTSDTLCLRHTANNGRPFLTVYAHLIPSSKSHLNVGRRVSRAEIIGRVQEVGYTHLHFGVAVRGPAATVNGVAVPELWYTIDPFGVYDYRRDRLSTTTYNYLPNNNITSPVRGIIRALVFRTNPIINSLIQVSPGRFDVYGTGCPGTSGAVPRHTGGGSPEIGRLMSWDVTHNVPSAPGVLYFGTRQAPISLATIGMGTCTLDVSLDGQLPIALNGIGLARLQFTVPRSSSLVGARMATQSALVDFGTATPTKVVHTAALETYFGG